MSNYVVTWTIDVEADSPKEAAAAARAIQLAEATEDLPAYFQVQRGKAPVQAFDTYHQVVDERIELYTVPPVFSAV